MKNPAFLTLQELLDLKAESSRFSLNRIKPIASNGNKRFCRLLSRGMEFEESRRYLPGDDVRSMDWKVTARTGRSHTKLFAEEKENKALIVLDMRRSMFFATEGVFKSLQAARLAGSFAWNALGSKNPLGGLIFNDEGLIEFQPAALKKGALPFFQAIAEQSKSFLEVKNEKTPSASFEKMTENLRRMAGSGSSIFLISDFRHMGEASKNVLIELSRHSRLFLLFLYDTFEKEIPKNGVYPVLDNKKEQWLNTYDEKGVENYRKQFLARKESVQGLSAHKNIHFIECSTKDDGLDLIRSYFL